MADKPRFVDPLLTQGPPPQQEPPPDPKESSANTGTETGAVAKGSSPASLTIGTTSESGSADAPVTGELVERPGPSLAQRRRQSLQEKHREKVQQVDDSIRLKAARTVDMMMDGSKVLRPEEDETGVGSAKPAGWTKRHFQIALDARLPDKDAPAYIRHAARAHDGAMRNVALAKGGNPSPALNCDITVVMKQEVTYKYEIVDSKED